MRVSMAAVLFFGVLLCGSQANAITVGQSDDFDDTTLQGWASGGSNPNPPVNVPDVGQLGVGDHVMQVSSNGATGGSGSKPVVFNSAQWTGDYLAAGVTEITLDINNLSAASINPGLEFHGPGGTVFTLAGGSVPANSGWQSVTISLAPSNLFGSNIPATLGAVSQLRFNNILNGAVSFPSGPTTAYYDNITAVGVPEPASAGLLLVGASLLLGSRRGSRC